LDSFTGTPDSKTVSALSDGALMLALQGGCDAALDQIMKRHKLPLFYFVTRYTRDEDTSYDIVQEAFFRVYSRAETYNPSYRFKTWLYQIALNLCRDYARKKKLQSLISLDVRADGEEQGSLHDVLASSENIESLAEHRQALRLLEKELDKLPHKLKTALILFVIEDNSQEECARILGVTPKTIEMRVYRARKMLMQKMAQNI
jgi:RNA polymerase sigma-70 factor (ECF subfamily)|tara:strand:- start:671 stop:1279 length:609 start_codon:yes stop_codon:yes gene_type:complete